MASEHETDDNIGSNEGQWFFAQEEPEQAVARKHEKAKTLEGLSILQQVVEQFDKDIEFYGSVDAIPTEVKLDSEKFMIASNINEGLRDRLKVKRAYIQGLIDTYAPNR